MAKAKKETKPKKRAARGKYEEKLAVNGSFLDIIKASVKDASSKSEKKKP